MREAGAVSSSVVLKPKWISRIGMCVAVVVMVVACGRSSPGRSDVSSQRPASTDTGGVAKTVEAALPELKAMVDATASVVGVGFNVQADTAFVPTGCEDSAGRSDGTVTAPYGVKFSLPVGTDVAALFDKARTFWRQHGYTVGTDNLTTSDPALHAWLGRYQLALHIPSRGQMAYLGGDTPCLPQATTR